MDLPYTYVSDWRIDTPAAAVWRALTEVEDWPRWWPYVREVHTLRRGDATGLGAVRRIRWSSRLPYGFTIDVSCTEVQPGRLLRGRSRGALEGEGLWELWPQGDATHVRYTWRLDLNTRWMRLAAPVLSGVFRWNHEGVMRGGHDGLERWLAEGSDVPAKA